MAWSRSNVESAMSGNSQEPGTHAASRLVSVQVLPGLHKDVLGDIIHVTDLYTTFARLGQAEKHLPTDRVIDGLDQTALLLNGETHGRRDYVFIYTGNQLGATVKGNFKQVREV